MNILRHPLLLTGLYAFLTTVFFSNSHFYSYVFHGGCFLIPHLFLAFIIHFTFWYSIIWLAGISRIAAFSLLPILLFTQMYCFQAEVTFGVTSVELAVATINTNWDEASVFLNWHTGLLLISGIAGILSICFLASKINGRKCNRSILISSGIFLAGALSLCAAPTAKALINDKSKTVDEWHLFFKAYHPALHSGQFWKSAYEFLTPDQLPSITDYASHATCQEKPEIVILYIGEAMRADHSPLNGYHRNTTPGIGSSANIINLPNVLSGATQTLKSIYSILTLTSPTTGEPTHGSFIDLLANHQYSQRLLVGANTEGWWYKTPQVAALFHPHLQLYSRPASAEQYADDINKVAEANNSPKFILIEDGAGHMPYRSEHKTFGEQRDIDKYDNCILDIDARLSAIINALKDRDAILLFTSDHGESFGEEGRYGHAGPMSAMEQRHVFSFIWYSDSYAAKRPEIVKSLKDNAAIFTSHDFIYHTIISMCGIHSDAQIPEQDMTRPH